MEKALREEEEEPSSGEASIEEMEPQEEDTVLGCSGQGVRQEPGGQSGGNCGVGIRLDGLPADDSALVPGPHEGVH